MADSRRPPKEIVKERGLAQITDEAELAGIVARVLAASAAQVEQYRSGREAIFGYLVGQVMKATGGRANPELANRLLKEALHG